MIPPRLAQRFAPLKVYWQRLGPRDRKAVSFLAIVAAIALLGQILWSVEQARQRAGRQLPRMMADAERMHQLIKNWRELKANPLTTHDTHAARLAVDRRIGELGKTMIGQWSGDGELLLKGHSDFSTWLRWTAAQQQESALLPVSCQLRRQGEHVEIEARYRLAGLTQ